MPNEKPIPQQIPIEKIHDLPGVTDFKLPEKSYGTLVSSILVNGLREPVILRPMENGEYQLVHGYRRRKAAELAKLKTLDALVYDMTEKEAKDYRVAVAANPDAPIPGKPIAPDAKTPVAKEPPKVEKAVPAEKKPEAAPPSPAKATAEKPAEKKAEAEAFYEKATIDNFLNLVYESVEEDMKEYFNPSSDSYNDSYTTAAGVNYSTIEKSFSKDVADWAYDSSRAVGDKFMTSVKADDGCTTFIIVVLKSLPYKDDTLQPVNVRHILLALTKDEEVTDDKGNKTTETKTIRTAEEAMEQAQAILDKWVSDGAKEDDFIKLAAEKSEDPGSADNGGLIEGIYTDSSYVKPFLEWAYADGRKVGDYGVVETEYGAHIMYMSSISDKTKWQADILTAMSNDASNKFYEDIVNDKAYSEIKVSNGLIKKVQNKIEDYAARVVETFEKQSAQQADSSADKS